MHESIFQSPIQATHQRETKTSTHDLISLQPHKYSNTGLWSHIAKSIKHHYYHASGLQISWISLTLSLGHKSEQHSLGNWPTSLPHLHCTHSTGESGGEEWRRTASTALSSGQFKPQQNTFHWLWDKQSWNRERRSTAKLDTIQKQNQGRGEAFPAWKANKEDLMPLHLCQHDRTAPGWTSCQPLTIITLVIHIIPGRWSAQVKIANRSEGGYRNTRGLFIFLQVAIRNSLNTRMTD